MGRRFDQAARGGDQPVRAVSSPADPLCEILEWDSAFFGLRIARFSGRTLQRTDTAAILRFCDQQQIDCLYLLLEAADCDGIRTASEIGGTFVDVRATLRAALPLTLKEVPEPLCTIRAAADPDLKALQGIARDSHHDTRFYADPRFDATRCDLLYETWIQNSCRGYADHVLVAECDGRAVAYLTCHRDSAEAGHIGLVAVSDGLRGRGIGGALLRAALRWFDSEGIRSVHVFTQARNASAQRLYERNGFLTAAVQLWFHLWPPRTRSVLT